MPNTASAKKRLRQNDKRRLHNRSIRTNMRGTIRRVHAAAEAGDHGAAMEALQVAYKKLDQAAARNIIHDNAAARTKSRLNAMVKKVAAGE